jgi:hypothetical protein
MGGRSLASVGKLGAFPPRFSSRFCYQGVAHLIANDLPDDLDEGEEPYKPESDGSEFDYE